MQNLILPNGQVQFGWFPEPPKLVDPKSYIWRDAMDKPINGWRKKMAFNQFQFIGLTGDDLILGVAIVNLKWVSNAFIYIYQPSTQQFEEFSWMMPFAMNTQVSHMPNGGTWSFKSGKNHISISATDNKRKLSLNVRDSLFADLEINEADQYHPLPVCCRAGYNGWVFTNKSTCRPVSGQLKWHNQTIPTNNLLASVDWSCGFMRRETFWNWASLSYQSESQNVQIGFNLAAGVNETSYTENGLWINGELIKLDRVEFIFDRDDRLKPWRVKTSDGLVNLEFQPEGQRKEKINAIIMASNFTQVFGRFNGQVKDKQGNVYDIKNGLGFCEDHYAKW